MVSQRLSKIVQNVVWIDHKKAYDMVPQRLSKIVQNVVWIDHKKAYDMVPQRLSKIVQDIRQSHEFQHGNHKNWKMLLRTGGKILSLVKIQRNVFQCDALSPLLFVMKPLNYIFTKCTGAGEQIY